MSQFSISRSIVVSDWGSATSRNIERLEVDERETESLLNARAGEFAVFCRVITLAVLVAGLCVAFWSEFALDVAEFHCGLELPT